jgi:type II secretory pathway component PulF
MADESEASKKRNSKSLQSAMRKLNVAEEYYAKFIISLSNKTRLKLYRKIASLMKNRFSLMDALDMLHDGASNGGKNPGEPLAIAIAAWGRALNNGKAFSDALKGWAPDRERLMLSVGDVSDLEGALLNLIKVSEGSTKMIRPIVGAIAYPSFLMMMAILIIYAIGVYMVPPMIEAAPNVVWRGLARNLVDLSAWIKNNWLVAFASLPVIMAVIYFTISLWTGKIRAVFDNIPPWSLYKIFTGISWLLALSALVKGGTPVSTAMRALRRDSTRYLRERIDKTMVYINNGDNLGQALSKTGLGFPDKEVINDLKIYSELDNFEEALDNLANEWLEESVYMIEERASILNMVALLAIGGVIAWAVMGTFDMQDQITSGMG